MSMHNQSETSFERINKSRPDTDGDNAEGNKSRKRCIIVVLLVCVLAAAITALILVLVLKGGSGGGSDIPKGVNVYSISAAQDGMWYYDARLKQTKNGTFPVPVDDKNQLYKDLNYRVSMMNDQTYRLRINPIKSESLDEDDELEVEAGPSQSRWEIPDSLLGKTQDDYGMRHAWNRFSISNDTVCMELSNINDAGDRYISTKDRSLIFTEYYLEMGFLLESQKIFGFGERVREFELAPGNYTSWSNGRDNNYDKGELGHHSYGDHPFVLVKLKNSFAGIFFKNSNAKSLEYARYGDSQSVLTFRAAGGVLDFFFLFGETAESVVKAYHGVIGVPYFPPFWALGFQQSSWQYDNTGKVKDVMSKYDDAGMPLEAMWLDIEYMNKYRNFEVDTARFSNIPALAQDLHQKKQKLVTIVDAGFAADTDYSYYKQASEQNLFIKSANSTDFNGNLIGKVWPGKAAFIDFTCPGSTEFWINGLTGLWTATTTDGIWIDMNEATTFCDGECPKDVNGTAQGKTYPFDPTGAGYSMQTMSLSLDGQHCYTNDTEKDLNTEFNMHSLYGTLQAKATFDFWIKGTKLQGRRPFVLSRSTFAGAGKYTSHWLGDNFSKWEYMRYSVSGIMNFQMFGIPLVGADVCGFHGKFDQEMCARWMQLSVFYPFARNHYNLTDNGKEPLPPQEPYNLEGGYKDAATRAIFERYSFLRYYYTRLFEISKWGGTLVRPLFFEFPSDKGVYQAYENSFMVGSALKATPVMTPTSENKGKVSSYFPAKSRFVSLNDFKTIVSGGDNGLNSTFEASWNYTIVHMRDGSVIPYQNMTDGKVRRTAELISDRGVSLVVFPDLTGAASGTLYIDENGDDYNDWAIGYYQYYKFRYANSTLSVSQIGGSTAKGDQTKGNQILDELIVLGQANMTGDISACVYDNNMSPIDASAVFDASINAVRVKAKEGTTLLFNSIQAIQFGSSGSTFCTSKYTVKSVTKVYKSDTVAEADKVVLEIESANPSLPSLVATFSLYASDIVNVKIEDPVDKSSFKAPAEALAQDKAANDHESLGDIASVLTLPKQTEEFFYEIHQVNQPSKILYSTRGMSFIYSKHYKKTSAQLDSTGNIFGLGERVGEFFLKPGTYTIWARDEPSPVENGKRPGNNIYGSHPVFFTQMSSSPTQFFAVFDNNAGAQDFIISKGSSYSITQIKTSGITDQFIILNNSISSVVASFIKLVGKPLMVPEWSTGWHQCRYGYNSSDQIKDVVQGYKDNKIPLDTMWADIDYMDMYKDFTVSTTHFKGLPDLVSAWKNEFIRFVPIMDAAVAYEPSSKDTSYSRILQAKCFIQDPTDISKPFVGKVWPGPAVYVDWLNKDAEQYWMTEMKTFYDKLKFDGLWIDMNEASNFCDGYCYQAQKVDNSVQNKLMYVPGARDLNIKSVSIDAKHSTGATEYEAHSLYGFYMSKATYRYFNETARVRPFIITRSSYTGVGKYSSHWLGDNFSTFEMMKYSVGGIYLFGMYGVPVTGADICGFIFDTTPELCARWYALGAFYPFSRNHNDKAAVPQEPYVKMFSEALIPTTKDVTYTMFFREASLRRYSLHRYHYSYTHKASTDGTVYFKPLFVNYPDDVETYKRVEQNILLGDSVKVSPILDPGSTASFYFPEKSATWCPIWPKYTVKCFPGQSYQQVTIPQDEIFVHIKSGSIIPLQISDLSAVTTFINIEQLKGLPTDIAVLMDSSNKASGWARFDDGETLDLSKYTEFAFSATGYSSAIFANYIDLSFSVGQDSSGVTSGNMNIGAIVIYNANNYYLKDSSKATLTTLDGQTITLTPKCNTTTNICRFSGPDGANLALRNLKSAHLSSS